MLDRIEMDLQSDHGHIQTVYIDVFNSSFSRKWLNALNHLLSNNYHLEKNYCFLGFPNSKRTTEYICQQINLSIAAINSAELGYHIDDYFSPENTIRSGPVGDHLPGLTLIHEKMNQLHRYFEDLQGHSGALSQYYVRANPQIRWHIRQLNLLCHEYESLVLSQRKKIQAPEWQRPSQLMCWLNAPRFALDENDYELFGIETINRPMGGVFVGVNKAVGKHHFEVYQDEGRDSRLSELTTSALRSQTEAAGDFDIEWAQNPGAYPWQQKVLQGFREWLQANGFDPEDKTLTIGFPQCGQVDLAASFGTADYWSIWHTLTEHCNVVELRTREAAARFDYQWSDHDFQQRQIEIIGENQ